MSLPGAKEGRTTALYLTYNVHGMVLHVAYQWQVSVHFTVNEQHTLMLYLQSVNTVILMDVCIFQHCMQQLSKHNMWIVEAELL